MNASALKESLYRAASVYGLLGKTLARGYRVLGNGRSTPYYLVDGSGSKVPAEQFIADVMTGLFYEVALKLEVELAHQRGEVHPSEAEEDVPTTVPLRELR